MTGKSRSQVFFELFLKLFYNALFYNMIIEVVMKHKSCYRTLLRAPGYRNPRRSTEINQEKIYFRNRII